MIKKIVLALVLGFLIGTGIVFVFIPGTLTVVSSAHHGLFNAWYLPLYGQ